MAIIDQVNTANPVLYYVHADHLDRPVMVTNSAGAGVWTALWTPFGAPYSITGSLTYNARFPGQWFQIESGLNWNWHRHYDPSTGAYVQPDPPGLAWLLSDGPSVYGYVEQQPTGYRDPQGLSSEWPASEDPWEEQHPPRNPLGFPSNAEECKHHGPYYPPPIVPNNYTPRPSQKGGGVRWCDPANPGTQFRICPAIQVVSRGSRTPTSKF